MLEEIITLVNENDAIIGGGEKMKVHRENILHRAFSSFVFTHDGKLILQKRAESKYHCGGLWTNTCCGHPRYGEDMAAAADRRLFEEMGFRCTLEELTSFCYQTAFDNGLFENEIDHIFCGVYDGNSTPDPLEVGEVRYETLETLVGEIAAHPEQFTFWFRRIFEDATLLGRLQKYVAIHKS